MQDAERGPYTIVTHAELDCVAGRTLSATARALYIEWKRTWSRVTRNGKEPRAVAFTSSGCAWLVERKTFDKARRELERHGFLLATNRKNGLFMASEAWRAYAATPAEAARVARQESEQSKQREHTKLRRSPSASERRTTPAESSSPTGEGLQCVRMTQRVVSQKDAPSVRSTYKSAAAAVPSAAADSDRPPNIPADAWRILRDLPRAPRSDAGADQTAAVGGILKEIAT